MKKTLLLPLLLLIATGLLHAQVNVSTLPTTYSQDFNTLANSGTSSTLPTGWFLVEAGGNTTYAADNGSTATGNSYSYGTTGNSERAFGGLQSGSVTPTIGAQFSNTSGTTILSMTINFTMEQWRIGTLSRKDSMGFQYSTDATSLNTGTWTTVTQLGVVAPTTTGVAGTALNGNSGVNRVVVSAYAITGLSIPSGSSIWIRFTSFDASNADDGLAVDDFTASFDGVALPACAEPTAQATNLLLSSTPTSISGSFTNASPAADDYIVVRSTSASLGAAPLDGTTYTVGQAIGAGTVISVAAGNVFADNGLTPNTHYYYFVFAYNSENCSGGPNYLTTLNAPPTGNTNDIFTQPIPACTTPAAAPTNLVLTPSNTSVLGSFTAVPSANRYLVVRSGSSSLGATPVNGTTYTAGQAFGSGTVVTYSSTNSFVATGLTANTLYYFFVFAANSECSGEPFYNITSLDASVTTTNVAGVPAGYYTSADGLSCQPLKTALRNITANGYTQLSYGDLWTAYQYTDMHRNDGNTADIIWDMYSDNPAGAEPYTFTFATDQCGSYNSEADCYNREHSTPKSWFNDAYPMYTDINHLYPTDGYVNNIRSNYPYGEVSSATYTSANQSKLGTGSNFGYAGIVFEPRNEFKGDFARASLYMATRYENEIIANNWSSNGNANSLFLSTSDQPDAAKRKLQIYDTWYVKTLFKWMNQDPVSQKETDRNNAVYYQSGQNNRNPYIDHPEYAALIWQCTGVLPVTIIDLTAQRNNESVLLRWYATFETSFKKYEVERSIDGISYSKIGEVAGRNLSAYDFTDNNLPLSNRVFYRLKMIDVDGQYRYSKTVSLQLGNLFSNALVYPNPTTDKITIKLEKALSANGLLVITDMSGRMVMQQTVAANNTTIPVIVKQLSAGRYFIRLAADNILINQSFVIVK